MTPNRRKQMFLVVGWGMLLAFLTAIFFVIYTFVEVVLLGE